MNLNELTSSEVIAESLWDGGSVLVISPDIQLATDALHALIESSSLSARGVTLIHLDEAVAPLEVGGVVLAHLRGAGQSLETLTTLQRAGYLALYPVGGAQAAFALKALLRGQTLIAMQAAARDEALDRLAAGAQAEMAQITVAQVRRWIMAHLGLILQINHDADGNIEVEFHRGEWS